MTTTDNDIATIVDLTRQAVTPLEIRADSTYIIVDANGQMQVVDGPQATLDRAERQQPKPTRPHLSSIVYDVASLLDVINHHTTETGEYRHAGGWLDLWADIDQMTITAILDGGDGWRRSTCTMKVNTNPQWDDWLAINGKLLDQVAFAEFLEDHLSTIAAPDGAELLEIAQTLQAHTNVAFKQQAILANGQRQFKWEENIEASAGKKGDLKVPGELVLVVAPFRGSDPVTVTARFRFRTGSDGLRLGVRLVEARRIAEEAFASIVAQVATAAPATVRMGRRA